MTTPVLETDRLRLRGHQLGDYPASCAMWGNPDVVRYISGRPSSPQQTWQRLLSYRGHWQLLDFGYWAIEEKTSGRFIGEVGFADYKRDLEPAMQGFPELGWALAPEVHGIGYGTEAVRAAIAWGDEHFPGSRTVCLISEENAASIRIARKVGFAEFSGTTIDGKTVLFYERIRAASKAP